MRTTPRHRRTTAAITTALALALTALAALTAAPGTARAAPPAPARHCRALHIPVALTPGQPPDQQVYAQYCTPRGPRPATADILIPGATYNHAYWDWPQHPATYSYVDKTLAAGRATIAIDRPGTGASSKPAGAQAAQITVSSSAYVLHQVISLVRFTLGYSQVDVIGHSLGSIIAATDAGTWPSDATRLVLTGYLNTPGAGVALVPGDLEPVAARPGYITFRPGTRSSLFYSQATADPKVVAYDEAHKDVLAATELATVPEVLEPPVVNPSSQITAPVDIVDGQQDMLFCASPVPDCSDPASVLAFERTYFRRAAGLSFTGIPDTGHDVALSTSAGESFAMINAWLTGH